MSLTVTAGARSDTLIRTDYIAVTDGGEGEGEGELQPGDERTFAASEQGLRALREHD